MNATDELNLIERVKSIVGLTLKTPTERISADATFDTIGIDSIVAMELMKNLSNDFDVTVTPAQFIEVSTVAELAKLIHLLVGDEPSTQPNLSENSKNNSNKEVSQSRSLSQEKKSQRVHKIAGNSSFGDSNRGILSQKKIRKNEKISKAIAYIKRQYSVDLAEKTFDNIEDIAEFMTREHHALLVSHYSRVNAPVADQIRTVSPSKNMHDSYNSDVAIVGISCNFPESPDVETFWNNLLDERNSIREIPKSRWLVENYYVNPAGPKQTVSKWGALINDVDCFDSEFFEITANQAKLMDPQERLLLQEVYKATQDANIDIGGLAGTNTGVFVGYEYAEYEQLLRNKRDSMSEGYVYSSSSPTYYLANRVSYIFDFCGPSESININCASSAVAMNRGYFSLLNKESNVAVVGGVSLNLFVDDYITATHYNLLSSNGTCAVFDNDANGFTRGEGVAAVILKRLEDAESDNDRIYGVIKSCHQNNRGKANDISEIKHEAITDVIRTAYEKSEINPETINYIEVDGYSTKWGDSFEFEGIRNVFGDIKKKAKFCALGSLKGNIAHLEPASGIASVIKIALSLHKKKFPATITATEVSDFIDFQSETHPLYLANKAIPFDEIRNDDAPIRAGVNSFSDSGTNVHILLEEYQEKSSRRGVDENLENQLFVISAISPTGLMEYIKSFVEFIPDSDSPLINVIYSMQKRESLGERLAIIAKTKEDLISKLKRILNSKIEKLNSLEIDDIYYGSYSQTGEGGLEKFTTKNMLDLLVKQHLNEKQWHEIAMLWTNGASISWNVLWDEAAVQGVSLPCYPFAKKKHWVEYDTQGDSEVVSLEFNKESNIVANSEKPLAWHFSLEESECPQSEKMDPLEKIELFLVQEVAFQLKCSAQDIDIDKNYLELGVASLGIAHMIQKINTLLKERLSPSIVFKHRDIRALSAFLVEKYPMKIRALAVTRQKDIVVDKFSENECSIKYDEAKDISESCSENTLDESAQLCKDEILEKVLLEDDFDSSGYEVVEF